MEQKKEELSKDHGESKPIVSPDMSRDMVITLDIGDVNDIADKLGRITHQPVELDSDEYKFNAEGASYTYKKLLPRSEDVAVDNTGRGIKTVHLKAIADKYQRDHKRPLVHVFAANSKNANHPPSEMGKQIGSGQAAVYCNWANSKEAIAWAEKNKEPYMYVAGIPTMHLDENKSDVDDDEIKHYVANLYFFLGQGKAICLPKKGGKFAFGGGEKQLSEDQSKLFQDELTKLKNFGNSLELGSESFKEFEKQNGVYYQAFLDGKNKPTQEWRGKYVPKAVTSKATAESKFIPAVDEAAVLSKIKEITKNDNWVCEKSNGDAFKFVNKNDSTQHFNFTKSGASFQASTNNPACFEVMAAAVMEALKNASNQKVKINSADPKLMAKLWLASIKAGLEVVDYDYKKALDNYPEIKNGFQALSKEIQEKVLKPEAKAPEKSANEATKSTDSKNEAKKSEENVEKGKSMQTPK